MATQPKSNTRAATPATPAEPASGERKSNKLLQARHAATAALIDAHREEFDQLYTAEAEKRGVTYTPELSEAQKAEQTLNRLLEDHPELAEKLRQQQAGEVPVETDSPSPVEAGQIAQG